MPYAAFQELFPEVARSETRSVIVSPGANPGLPPAEYKFFEMYCDEPGCDCRRVMFSVMSSATGRMEAVVAWGWESLDFYRRWMGSDDPEMVKEMQGPVLNLGSPQTENSAAILELARRFLLNDPAYMERLKRHYTMFREKIDRDGRMPNRKQWASRSQRRSPKMAAEARRKEKKRGQRGSA